MKQPNILFIMCDDHTTQAMGCYGSRINRTPAMDRIAAEGLRFDHCYVTNSICTPSRAAILTGTHNHINRVTTLDTHLDNRLPNVAKHLQRGGYQTAVVGKWHLGHGPLHDPSGFDYWSVVPGQGRYYDPEFLEPEGMKVEPGYVTDITTDKALDWLEGRDRDRPFFLMLHHKAPHRPWDPKREHRDLYRDPIPRPDNFEDDYSDRASAAAEARMRIVRDMSYTDLDLVEEPDAPSGPSLAGHKTVPFPDDPSGLELRCVVTGEVFRFESREALADFKYQRYLSKYLQCVHSIDENVGRVLDALDKEGIAEDTVVIYTSDQGFYLGEHGWFDKRFIYEESFRMPFLVRYPREIQAGGVCEAMGCNVDFAPTFLDLAGLTVPNYMQGRSLRELFGGTVPDDWTGVAYHRYWMNRDRDHNALAHYGIRTHDFKLIYWYDEDCAEPGATPGRGVGEWELFDLRRDPSEMCNVYHQPEYRDAVREMTARLEAEMERIGDLPLHPAVSSR